MRIIPDRHFVYCVATSVFFALCAIACRDQEWRVARKFRAPDVEVAAALGDTAVSNVADLSAADVPEIKYPLALRPCCAFGADLKVAVGRVPVPGVDIGNLLDVGAVGAHRYDNGYISLQGGDPRGVVDNENNGLIYTCRGGFIDLAHVRDNADNTLSLVSSIARSMETGTVIEVPPQGAQMRVRTMSISPEGIAKYGRIQLAVVLAQWVAYQLSIWHEIATFYGYASIASWPEKISAFSPEDLYSNQIGIRLAGGIVRTKGARSDLEYGVSMDAWIERMLERLRAVPLNDSRSAIKAVDGAWWDSEKRIPDWTLVKRRQFHTGPFLPPWRLEDARPGANGNVTPLARCEDAGPPLVLNIHDGFAGALFSNFATVELDIDDTLVANAFPLPRSGSRRITQADFPGIIEAARLATLETFGPGADAP